mgnify:CR=1 FL=1
MIIDGLFRVLPLGVAGALLSLSGCSNDFGQPCELPQTEEFRRACETVAGDQDEEEQDTQVISESKASCAGLTACPMARCRNLPPWAR